MVKRQIIRNRHRSVDTWRYQRRPSTPEECSEFREHLTALGIDLDADRWNLDRWHHVRCVFHDGDRGRSLRVNPQRCAWVCGGCEARGLRGRGGLQALREHLGVTPENRSGVSIAVGLRRLAEWCSPGADPLALVPVEAVEELRERTGRHKRDRTLSDNLARVLASVWQRMTDRGLTIGVAFTALDATRDGISAGLWQDVVATPLRALQGRPLVSLWLDVEVGESGRKVRGFRGSGKGGTFRATTVGLTRSFQEYPTGEAGSDRASKSPARDIPGSLPPSPEVTLTASVAASVPKSDAVTLHRRRSVAMLLAVLNDATRAIPDTFIVEPTDSLDLGDLVAMFGPRIRRVVRVAASFGWVSVCRMPGRGAGFVTLTSEGRERLADDLDRGRWYRNDRADRLAAVWASEQERIRSLADHRSREARVRAHARRLEEHRSMLDTSRPWVSCGRGRVRHVETGEVRTLEALRG